MIEKVNSEINTKFVVSEDSAPWYTDFIDTNQNDETIILSNSNREALLSFLNLCLINVSKNISHSILIGEYIYDNEIEAKLELVVKNSERVFSVTALVENKELYNYIEGFNKIIKETCIEYKRFYKHIQLHLTSPNTNIHFNTVTSRYLGESESYYKLFNTEVKERFNEVDRLIQLNLLDHFFHESKEYFRGLISFENALHSSNSTANVYIGAMTEKVHFLKYKWIIRQNTTRKILKDNNRDVYIVDNESFDIYKEFSFSSQNARLREWKEYLENHYGYVETSFYTEKKPVVLKNKNNYTYNEFHFLIKYYKDINPNYKELCDLIDLFFKQKEEEIDTDIFQKNYNYALNNQFSFLIKIKNVKEEDVIELKDKIDSFQQRNDFNNFFVDYKYLEFNISKLDDIISKRNALEIHGEINERIEKIRELIISCERKISWSQNHQNLLYQLPYDESLINYNSEDAEQIYYASSFLLPLSLEQTYREFKKIKLKFENEYNYFQILPHLQKEFVIISQLRSDAEKLDKKSIENLTIFTAIISFIIGSVSGFSFVKTFSEAIIFLLTFSIALITFGIVIFIATGGIKIKLKSILAIVSILVIYLISFGVIIYNKEKIDKSIKSISSKEEKTKNVDSLSTAKNKIFKLKEGM